MRSTLTAGDAVRRGLTFLLAAAILLLLVGGAGCALFVPEDERERAYRAFLAERAAVTGWSVAGRAALRADGEAVTMSLRWQQAEAEYELALAGPFGAGSARIRGGPEGVVFEDGSGRRASASDPERLVAEQTGYVLPVTALRDWVIGRPAQRLTLDARTLDASGRPQQLVQDGWRVEYRGWGGVDGIDLPTRIELRRGSVELRVALSGWRLERERE